MTFHPLDSALTGPLFATPEMRDVFSDVARLRAMLTVEVALAGAEAAAGLAPDSLADAIAAIGLERLDAAAIGERTALAGVPTIPFVKAVQALLPPGLEASFHKGATTQDIVDTALVLQVRNALDLLAAGLDRVMAGLAKLAQAHRAAPCVGRTYGQHAAPLTFGFKAAVWLAGFTDVAVRLPGLRSRVLVASLGGPVGTLAGLGAAGPEVSAGFARLLGLQAAPLAWHTRRGVMVELGCWVAQLIGTAAKMATDIAHLASTEVSEVSEPFVPGRGGSTAMPHKRNPVSCTVILAAHAAAPGYAATLLGAMAAAHERPAGLWHAEWHALPTLLGLASGVMRESETLASGMEVDTARMRRNIDLTQGLLFTDAASALLSASIGREAAHGLVKQAAAIVRDTGETLAAVLARDPAAQAIDLRGAFDLFPAIAAAGPWVDAAVDAAGHARALLRA